MKVYLKEIKFESKKHTYFKDITEEVAKVLKKAEVKNGFVLINSKHTTLGVVVQEIAEPHLLEDILNHTLCNIPEDRRSTRAGKEYGYPTSDYLHRCQDNPFCNEVDEDYNAASHIRAMTYSHPSVTVPIRGGKLELGKYQQIALMEFDGRDGSGKNPVRQRTVQIWVYCVENIEVLLSH